MGRVRNLILVKVCEKMPLCGIFLLLFQIYAYCAFLHYAGKGFAYQRACYEELPGEGYREVNGCHLRPDLHDAMSIVEEHKISHEAHKGAHHADGAAGDGDRNEDGLTTARVDDTEGKLVG